MVTRIASYIFLTVTFFLISNCSIIKTPKEDLFQSYIGKPIPNCFENFDGIGNTIFPDFLSWGCFTYKTNFNCIDSFYLQDTFITPNDTMFLQSNSERIFTIANCNEFPNDLSFYQKAIDKKIIDSVYNCENKIFITGIRFPYAHYILYDTVTFEVVHLVSGVRE